ncbi:redoxin domain-containing protein [Acidobacteriota bacterium]
MKWKHSLVFCTIVLLFLATECKKTTPTSPIIPDLEDKQTALLHITATITLNGAPFADVEIFLSGSDSKKNVTDADGTLSFTDLPVGTYYITPSKQGYSFFPAYFEFNASTENYIFTAHNASYGSEEGSIMANFSAMNQDAKNISLYDFFGQVVLINLSADWCVPCRNEAPQLNTLFNTYRNRGFHVISLLSSGDNKTWANEYSLEFPVLDDRLKVIYNIYRTGYVPVNILINRNGHILYKASGYNEFEIVEWLNKILEP